MNNLKQDLFNSRIYNFLFSSPPDVPEYSPGDTIAGRYALISKLDGGCNSDVYTALDTVRNKKVVIKYVNGDPFKEETLKRQEYAVSEFRKWSSVVPCDRFLPMYDAFYDVRIQKYAIVTPYIEKTHPGGLSLGELIENGYTFREEDAEHLFREVYIAIRYIKETTGKLYTHRDFKPDNLFVVLGDTDAFSDCTVMLADCGSYSLDGRYLGKYAENIELFLSLEDKARDLVMLFETAEKMCPGYRKGKSEFSAFVRDMEEHIEGRSILDFQGYFGEVTLPENERDPVEYLLAAYNEYTFADAQIIISGKDKRPQRVVERFQAASEEYYRKSGDKALPMFLCLKDCQAVGEYSRAQICLDYFSENKFHKPYLSAFCEYSADFDNEIAVRQALVAFHNTALPGASEESLISLCRLFAKINPSLCFDFGWMTEAVVLCEYMLMSCASTFLLDSLTQMASDISQTSQDSPQVKRDKELFCSVIFCMAEKDQSRKIRYALSCASLALAEPYNVNYLFFAAKTLMISSEVTAAHVFCSALVNETNQIIRRLLPTDNMATLINVLLCLYWLTAYPGHKLPEYTNNLIEMLNYYIGIGDKWLRSVGSKAVFDLLKYYIRDDFTRNQAQTIEECIENINRAKSSPVYGCEKLRQYRIGLLYNLEDVTYSLVSAITTHATEEKRRLSPEEEKQFLDFLEVLEWADNNTASASSSKAWLAQRQGKYGEASGFYDETYMKIAFSMAEDPFCKNTDAKGYLPHNFAVENNVIHIEHCSKMAEIYSKIKMS